MKRESNLFEKIISIDNINEAFLKALKRKRNSPSAIFFCQNVDENLKKIQARLKSENPDFGHYRQFKIFDPKERVITAATFEERVMHHAIMNVLEEVFEKQFIFHTYACRKNKGMHKAVAYAQKQCRKYKYFAKFDVRKYFDNINHEILKTKLERIIKDKECLNLLFCIIDSFPMVVSTSSTTVTSTSSTTVSNKGLPIGNLTSQFFANLYLSSLDHFILEELKTPVVRYMDDFIVFADDIKKVKRFIEEITIFLKEKLFLELKPETVGLCSQGVPFLGCLVRPDSVHLLKKTRNRRMKKMKNLEHLVLIGKMSEEEAGQRCSALSYF
ncbi:MAG: hypothetical protein HUK25_07380 [Treponema sp.]|nr:hypothetical protein [Treponema sp.]